MARKVIRGVPVSPGIAIGEIQILPDAILYEKRHISSSEVENEIEAIKNASATVCGSLEETSANIPPNLSEYHDVIAAQTELARDARILDGAIARVRHKKICAAWALSETIEELASLFKSMADPYLSERAQDIKLIGKCLGSALGGCAAATRNDLGGILAAYDLSPAHVLKLKLDGIQAILTVEGGISSHTAILARGLKVPALVGISSLFAHARNNATAIVDAFRGQIILDPDASDLEKYQKSLNHYNLFEQNAKDAAKLPAVTVDGKTVKVRANIDNLRELSALPNSGAAGIGLYRTEFSYLGGELPDEESLHNEYCAIIGSAGSQKVIFRTLDVGADKILPVQEALHEPNPALGLRGIRFCLKKEDIFVTQLRAILRASHGANAAIMLPMVSTLAEIAATRQLIAKITADLASNGIPHAPNIELGVMIETPAAVMISDAIAASCDFISIGTNDLLHYLMAIDRNNRHVAYLHDPLHPAFIRCLKQIIDSAHKHGREVSVCGELAADAAGIALLLGMDIDALSGSPRFVPAIKHILRNLNSRDCASLARMAMDEQDGEKIKKLLDELLHDSVDTRLRFIIH